MSTHRVGIIITTYNRAHYLRTSVESVLRQSFDNWVLTICDDASTDGTAELCEDFAARDPRIQVLRNRENRGMVSNARQGFEASEGEFFARLDDDNLWLPTFLEKVVAALDAIPEASFAFSDEWFVNEDGQRDRQSTEHWAEHYGRTRLRPGLQADSVSVVVQQATGINVSLFRRSAVEAVGGFSAHLTAGLDYDLFLKLASAGHRCTFVPERLGHYRLHAAQSTSSRLHHVQKAKDIVTMLEACHFEGHAEKQRRARLSTACLSLGRTELLNHHFLEARAAATQACWLKPLQVRSYLILFLLSLPTMFQQPLLNWYYEPWQAYQAVKVGPALAVNAEKSRRGKDGEEESNASQ